MTPDYGPSTAVRARRKEANRRVTKRAAMKVLLSTGDSGPSSSRLRELATRDMEMKRARALWIAIPAWQRFCLDLLGYDALSWSARKELRDLAMRAKEASRMVRL